MMGRNKENLELSKHVKTPITGSAGADEKEHPGQIHRLY